MRKRVSKDWMEKRREDVARYLCTSETQIKPVVTAFNPAAQWYIRYLEANGIRSNIINLGAGVKKIIISENLCPHCEGSGVIK